MFRTQKWPNCWVLAGLVAAWLGAFALAGCERKERVVDIETPGVDVKVDRNIDTGEIEVDANKD
jgi:hypothetical protein